MKNANSRMLILCILILTAGWKGLSQENLTIEKIMSDPKWIGVSPENPVWSDDGQTLYFRWNPESEPESDLYAVRLNQTEPFRVSKEEKETVPGRTDAYNRDRTKKVFIRNGDVYLHNLITDETLQVTATAGNESSPAFNWEEDKIVFSLDQNLYTWNIKTGQLTQLTRFQQGKSSSETRPFADENEKWLHQDQLQLFEYLRKKKEEMERRADEREAPQGPPYTIYTGSGRVADTRLSPCERYITCLVYDMPRNTKSTLIPHFVTETGYTEETSARPKVGTQYTSGSQLHIYDTRRDTSYSFITEDLPGLSDPPGYLKDYPNRQATERAERKVMFGPLIWSPDGKHAVLQITSLDNKDRWIMLADPETGHMKLLDRQRDEAWIGGPGIGQWNATLGWMPDGREIFFQSEESGYSHLYTVNIQTGKKKALTRGEFEIYDPFISRDKKYWYFTSNAVHSGERHLYRMPLNGGKTIRLTFMEGRNDAWLSPDESMIALIHSESNCPEELYLMENREGAEPVRITHSLTEEFLSYSWRKPELIRFKARDGVMVPARLYRPDHPVPGGPAVIFVHGAGYLQNAHKWWSSYFREYMFHNFLADHGYTVLDIDYRGSAGYGRNWRTAIYRHMGGKDLDDQVDGARWLVKTQQIDPARIGIYGGSYGGFITLMAMFKEPGVFAAGAALRSVTDWAHYNHGYTSNILNTPAADSLSYVRSSPIYYAEGLQGALLMCHGMVDDNVHFQDIVRLVQRLIELGKENWELAVYPVESHAFTEPASWTDEYKRIFKLFEGNLK
ncbi:MAG: prolyl oligopeptidase family serine peptidase [Bacteroidales bacterium]